VGLERLAYEEAHAAGQGDKACRGVQGVAVGMKVQALA
jgi:hypothetical protein